MARQELIETLRGLEAGDWARLAAAEPDYRWDAAWEAALAAGAEPAARRALAAARQAGAGPRAAALAAAAVAAAGVAPALDAEQLRALCAPLADLLPVPTPAPVRRRSSPWAWMRRCPVAAAAAAVR